MPQTIFRTCTLCEATCGLAFEVEDNRIRSVRADADDVFSKGYVCPKGIAIADVHHDPDRLRSPVRRTRSGAFRRIPWREAFDRVTDGVSRIREQHGADAVGFYWGNPTANNHGALLLLDAFTKALGTRNRYSANSQDANPRLVVSYFLYGSSVAMPASRSASKAMRTRVPPPALSRNAISPRCSSTIFLTIARPRPVPRTRVVI